MILPFCDARIKIASLRDAPHVELLRFYGSTMRNHAKSSVLISRPLALATLDTW